MAKKNHFECWTELRKQLKQEDSNLGYVRFLCVGTSNGVSGQYIDYSTTVTKRDGSKKEVNRKSFVTHKYCPLCGGKL